MLLLTATIKDDPLQVLHTLLHLLAGQFKATSATIHPSKEVVHDLVVLHYICVFSYLFARIKTKPKHTASRR
jgi:hypothetical protein